MASSTVYRNNVKFYSIELSVSTENISDYTTRVSFSGHVSFGDWYQYGVRLHVSVGGVEVTSAAGATWSSWGSCAYVSGSRDISRGNSGSNCWVGAWTTSETVSGCGGAPSTTSCGENAWIPEIPAYKPDAPSGLTVSRASDSLQKLAWTNNPDDSAKKYYSGINVYRHTNGGSTETLYGDSTISNYSDGSTKADCMYDYDVRARWRGGVSDMSNSVRVYTSPAPPSSAKVEKTSASTAKITVGSGGRYATRREAQVSTDDGKTWDAVDGLSWSKAGDGYEATHSAAPAGTVKYRVRNAIDNPVNGSGETLYSAWVETGSIVTICPPLAPAITTGSSVFGVGDTVVVEWEPNHPDGSAQTAAQLEVKTPGGNTLMDISGSKAWANVVASAKGSYQVRVRTKGLDESWGAWSAYAPFSAYNRPTAEFTRPSADGAVVSMLPYTAMWEASDETGFSRQRISVRDDSTGRVIANAKLAGDVREWKMGDIGLSNGGKYTLSVFLMSGSGLSATIAHSFVVAWADPMPPELSVSYGDGLSAIVTARFVQTNVPPVRKGGMRVERIDSESLRIPGTAVYSNHGLRMSSSVPRTASASIARAYDGDSTMLAQSLSDGQSAIDRLPPLNSAFSYVATAFTSNGASKSASIDAFVDSRGAMAFNFGADAARSFTPLLDIEHSASFERSATAFHFANGGSMLPMFYAIDEYDETRGYGFSLVGEDEYRAYEGEVVREWCGWLRDTHGVRRWCRFKWDEANYDRVPWAFKANVSATVGVWREPSNG